MPKRSTTTPDKANITTNKRQCTKKSSALDQKGGNISPIDFPSPQSSSNGMSTMPGKHNNVLLPGQQLLPAAAPRHRHQNHQHHRVSEVVSDVSSVDNSTQGRSRANSDDCIPIPSHVTTKVSGQSSFPVTSVARPVSSTGSGSGIFFEGRELPPTSPVNGTVADNHDDKEVVIPTFFDTNKVANTVDDVAITTTSDQLGVVYDLVPSSLRSRATAFTPLLPSPVLLDRDVASYLLKEQGHADANNDNNSIDEGASIGASIQSENSIKTSKRASQSESEKKKTKLIKKRNEPVMLSLQLDQYAIHMKTQRLRSYLKKRAVERRAVRRAENERNSGRTAHACRSSTVGGSTAIPGSANRSAAASPIVDMMGAAVPQTGIKLQLPRPMSLYTSITTTDPPGCLLPSTVSYDTATDATTNAATAATSSYDHPSTLAESAPLSACSQDVLDAAVALTRCLTTKHVS